MPTIAELQAEQAQIALANFRRGLWGIGSFIFWGNVALHVSQPWGFILGFFASCIACATIMRFEAAIVAQRASRIDLDL